MISFPLVFDKDQIVIVENTILTDSTYQTNFDFFKNELINSAMVSKISSSSSFPGVFTEWHYKRHESDDYYHFKLISLPLRSQAFS